MDERYNRMKWIFKKEFTAVLAKCLVEQSPYPVPDNLEKILTDFHKRIPYDFDKNEMAKVSLSTMTETIYNVLESMPDVMALNDFIDIMAVAQNITREFADKADAQCWLNLKFGDC